MTEITHTANSIRTRAEERSNKAWRLKEEIISKLGLETKPEYVSDNQPLFGRGLEMDSLDTLEVVVAVNNEFGVSVNDDDVHIVGRCS